MLWFRMYAEYATDPKVQSMDETLQRRFTMFLCLHCNGEYDRLSDDELACALRISTDELSRTREVFRSKGFLGEDDEIRNWNKRQYKSDDVSIRVKKHREKKKKRTCNVTVSPSESDSDTDSEKNKKTPSESLVALKRDDAALEVFVHWQREWKHPTTKLDQKRRKRIEARLKDFTPAQLCDAISGFRHSPWHTGTDPKGNGTVYDSIETLLRDSGQVEKGIGLYAHPPRPPPRAETAHDRMQKLLNGDDSRVIEHVPDFPAISGR
jgi:hypothetical protein